MAAQGLDCPAFALLSARDRRFTRGSEPLDVPGFLRSLCLPPTIIYRPAPEEGAGFMKRLLTWAPLLGLIPSPLTGFAMVLLALLGHHRKRGEDILLQLQLIKINLENENPTLVNRNLPWSYLMRLAACHRPE